ERLLELGEPLDLDPVRGHQLVRREGTPVTLNDRFTFSSSPTVNSSGYSTKNPAQTIDGFVAALAELVGLISRYTGLVRAMNSGQIVASSCDAAKSWFISKFTSASKRPGLNCLYPFEPKFVNSTTSNFGPNAAFVVHDEASVLEVI